MRKYEYFIRTIVSLSSATDMCMKLSKTENKTYNNYIIYQSLTNVKM